MKKGKDIFRHISTAENQKARKGDPIAWECLSDQQRDIIDEWYMGILAGDYDDSQKREQELARLDGWRTICTAIPMATYFCIQNATDSTLNNVLWFLLYLIIFAVVFTFAEFAVTEAAKHKDHPEYKIIALAGVWAASFIVCKKII
jgi:hypothetical protein